MQNARVQKLLSSLTIEEKARLCSGKGFWHTVSYEDKKIPSIMLSDGPNGLRKQEAAEDHLGLSQSAEATCFPCAAAMASSWDVDLLREVGRALGDECLAQGVGVLLGPGMNIKRSPLCGRNFEYFSEDPCQTAQMAGALVAGVQSRGVGCAVKHFAANNQETQRMTIDAVVGERALREIYLSAFEAVVKTAKPWMVMSAYNRVNGLFCSENERLLGSILRDEWGFDGAVVSDWGGTDDRVEALRSGMDLEMPDSGPHNTQKIIDAVQSCRLAEETLNRAAQRVISLAIWGDENKREAYKADYQKHHLLARRTAAESMVLLKNRDATLPLRRKAELAVIGAFASSIKYQGAGSSRVNPTRVDNIFEELAEIAGPMVGITHAPGYSFETDVTDLAMIEDAVETARCCENIVVIAGVPDRIESEGYDRASMKLPDNQNALIEELATLGKRIVVVLIGGAPIELPWFDRVDAVIATYLGGQAMAGALARVLFGNICPSGKLTESWPDRLEHNPSYLNFPESQGQVVYHEGVFVGYRYYLTKKIAPRFPFGFGLSYTSFHYTNLRVSQPAIAATDALTVSLDMTNTGYCAGKEIVQLYIAPPVQEGISRPVRELRGFAKVELAPRETKTVSLTLTHRDFAWYDASQPGWRVDAGTYRIQIGASCEDIRLEADVDAAATALRPVTFTPWSTIGEIAATPAGAALLGQMLGGAGPNAQAGDASPMGVDTFALIQGMPLKKIIQMSGTDNPDAAIDGMLQALNAGR